MADERIYPRRGRAGEAVSGCCKRERVIPLLLLDNMCLTYIFSVDPYSKGHSKGDVTLVVTW